MKKLLSKLRGFFPTRLPTGKTEFDTFCLKIFDIYDLPDMRSYREAIATMIMHSGPTVSTKSLYYFAKSIRKAQANQVAYNMLMVFKEEAKAEEEAEKLEKSEKPADLEAVVESVVHH